MGNEIGRRVRGRLDANGILHKDAAERVNMTRDALSRALKGERAFTARELAGLADLLDTSIDYLVTGSRGRFEPQLAARHTWNPAQAAHEPHDWAEAKRVVADPLLAYEQARLESVTRLPAAPKGPVQAAALSRALLEERAGADFVSCLPDAIEMTFGIEVFILGGRPVGPGIVELPTQGAYAAMANLQAFIVVGTGGEWYRKNFALAHELGHIVGRHLAFLDEQAATGAQESWANLFAAEMLMPTDKMREIPWDRADLSSVAHFLAEAGVSTEALRNRLNALKLECPLAVDVGTPALIRTQLGEEAYELLADTYQRPRFPQRIVDAHSELVESGSLPPHTLAWMLGIRAEDLAPPDSPRVAVDELAQLLDLA